MAEFMQKMMSARAILKKEKTKEEVAKELGVGVRTVAEWVKAVKTAAVNEHIRMTDVKTKEKTPKTASEKPKSKKVVLPAPPKEKEPKKAEPVINAEPIEEEAEWDLI